MPNFQDHYDQTIFEQTREIAGKFAGETVEAQSKEFQGWGLMADWDNRYRFANFGNQNVFFINCVGRWTQDMSRDSSRLF